MRKVLVTGGAGFLGSHIAERLITLGFQVVIVDNLSGGRVENVQPGCSFVEADIRAGLVIENLFKAHRFDAVVHCAAFASENLSHECRLHTYGSIVMGSANLINYAVNYGVKLFVTMSSIAVYGRKQPPFTESDSPAPIDPYGAAKLATENDLQAAQSVYGMDGIIFRPHNIIGTRQNIADSTRNVASIFIRQALEGKPLTVFGDGNQTRAFSPVEHVAEIIAASISRPQSWNQTFNIGGDTPWRVIDLAKAVLQLTGSASKIEHLPERHEARHAFSDHTRMRRVFPEFFTVQSHNIMGCLKLMVQEACKNGLPPMQSKPPLEITVPCDSH